LKAVVKTRSGDGYVKFLEVDEPKISSSEVLLEVRAAGICGSDIRFYRGKVKLPRTPVILGHEFSARIIQVGKDVRHFDVGDRVTCETHAYVCGQCGFCRTGKYNLCSSRKAYGHDVDGAFANYVKARPDILHHLPQNLSFDEAAITEPLCVVLNGIHKLSISPGSVIAILGPGPIGLLSLQVVKQYQPYLTIVTGTERREERLSLAGKLGADETIIVQKEDSIQKILELTGKSGVDIVIECSGSPNALSQALEIVKKEGQILQLGYSSDDLRFTNDIICLKAIKLMGSFSHNWIIWEQAINLLAKRYIDVKSIVSHTFSLDKWKEGFKLVDSGKGVKVLLNPLTNN
jgi:threonine dehydrogenase-like Zn-dependent dehydrogenase